MRLSGPLQSWGGPAAARDWPTQPMPSYSGVMGLIAAAEGRPRDADLSDLAGYPMGVRADRPGTLLEDYQTAQALPGRRMARAGGGWSKPGETIVIRKMYLSDAVFLVAIEADQDQVQRWEQVLRAPYYPLFLGRRGCPPDRPVVVDTSDQDLQTVLASYRWLGSYPDRDQIPPPRLLVEASDPHGSIVRQDVPLSWAVEARRFGYRNVRRYTVVSGGDRPSHTDQHDPFALLSEI